MNTGRKTIKGTSPKRGTRGIWERGFWKIGTCTKRNTLLGNIGRKRLLVAQKTPKGTHFWQNRKRLKLSSSSCCPSSCCSCSAKKIFLLILSTKKIFWIFWLTLFSWHFLLTLFSWQHFFMATSKLF